MHDERMLSPTCFVLVSSYILLNQSHFGPFNASSCNMIRVWTTMQCNIVRRIRAGVWMVYFTRHAYAHQQHFSFIAKLAGGDSQEIAKPVISWEHKPLGRDGVSWLSQSRADRQWIRCYPHIHSVFHAYASLKYKFCGSLSFFFSTKTTVLCFAI